MWPGVRPWILGSLGFLVLLIFMDWMIPGLLDMWPLLLVVGYVVYAVIYSALELKKPRNKRDWGGLFPLLP